MGQANPFRYRGYYYDAEGGLYYLQSRYYDPVIGRFVSADEYVSTGQGIVGYNMFAYCGNNPVTRADSTGHFWTELWEFVETVVAETSRAMEEVDYVYVGSGCLAALDGPLPFGDVVALSFVATATVGAAAYGVYSAAKAKAIPRAKEKEIAIAQPVKQGGQTYYYVTTPEYAAFMDDNGIDNSKVLKYGPVVSVMPGPIFVWDVQIVR